MDSDKQHVYQLLDRLDPSRLAAVVHLLEVMVGDEDDELTEEDRSAIAISRDYFRQGGQGVPFEKVVTDCGFTMEQIRGAKRDK